MSTPLRSIHRKLPSKAEACARLIGVLLEVLESEGWSKDDAFAIRMAVEEAVMNAIKHGNQEAVDKQVDVNLQFFADRFYGKIDDQGHGFRPEDVPDPTRDENLEKTSGRGVALIRSFVDEVHYNQSGNSIELIKYRSDGDEDPPAAGE